MAKKINTIIQDGQVFVDIGSLCGGLQDLAADARQFLRPLTLEEAQKRFNQSTKGIELIYTPTGFKHKLVFVSNTGTMLLRRLDNGSEWRCDYKKLFTDFTFTDGANIGEYDARCD